jgi:kinesin family protein 11
VASLLETIIQESQSYVQTERKSLLEAKAHSDTATSAEITRLQEQNVLLTKLLESEKQKSEKAKDLLISRISGLLGEFTADRDKSLRETFGEMRDRNVVGETEMERCGRENGERIVGVVRAGEDWSGSLVRRGAEGKRLRDGAIKVCHYQPALLATASFSETGIEFVSGHIQERSIRRARECNGIRIRLFKRIAKSDTGS